MLRDIYIHKANMRAANVFECGANHLFCKYVFWRDAKAKNLI